MLPGRGLLGVAAQDLDVGGRRLAGRGGVVVGDVGQVGGVDDDVDAVQFAQLAQFQGGERALERSAPTQDHDLGHAALAQRLEGMVGDVGGGQNVRVGDQDAGDVDRDVAISHHDGPACGDVGVHLREVRVRVVPADEVHRGDAAGEVLTPDAHRAVGLGADGVNHRVVALRELVGGYVFADGHVAEEVEPRVLGRLLESPAHRLDFGVVGGHSGADQTPRGGEHLEHVDHDVRAAFGHRLVSGTQQGRRGEVSGRARADDRQVVRTHGGKW